MALKVLYSQINWNIEMIASITNDQTFYVVDTKLIVEDRMFSSFLWRSPETRKAILSAVQTTLNMLDELLTSYQNSNFLQTPLYYEKDATTNRNITDEIQNQLDEICKKQDKVESGLKRLATFTRYQRDHSFQLSINRAILEFGKLCNRAEALRLKQDRIQMVAEENFAKLKIDLSPPKSWSDRKMESKLESPQQSKMEEVTTDEDDI